MIQNVVLLFTIASCVLSSFSVCAGKAIKKPLSPEFISQIPGIYPPPDINDVKVLLDSQAPSLSEAVRTKVLTAVKCATTFNVNRSNILSVIDYSLPSNQKRLWIFDLNHKQLLFHTYVSHGIKSGTLLTDSFSNTYNSKASSMGVYRTEKAYYGREGLSLRLEGLDKSFNDNAFNRSIVMHGGWYVEEPFIKKYGRPGRSWGCPALPLGLYQPIINAIKDSSLMVVYYPSDEWFGKSKFLTCDKPNSTKALASNTSLKPAASDDMREQVLFAQVKKGGEDKPILVVSADNYQKFFHAQAPLERMLRRQINKSEYVALSTVELNQLIAQNNKEALNSIYFVIPVLHMVRGYYETKMQVVNLGAIQSIQPRTDSPTSVAKNYTVNFGSKSQVRLEPTNRFIRWLGL